MRDVASVREVRECLGGIQRPRMRLALEPGGRRDLRPVRRLSRVVALGGGTGLPTVLAGLRRHLPSGCRITAIVTAADDGGSSGVLREQYGVLPPGDIRNCLVALARVAPEISAALQYRFDGPSGPPHPVGNLLLTALDMVAADEVAAIRLAAGLLGVEDAILPSTVQRIHLVAELLDGRSVRGESAIPRSGALVARVRIDPSDARPAPGVLEALHAADTVILGPGSLYTSVLATLVVPAVAEAIAAARATRIFVCNLMTEPGETDGYGVAAHLEALAAHGLPPEALDYVVVNTRPIPPKVQVRYTAGGAEPVRLDIAPDSGRPRIVAADVLDSGVAIRHAPDKPGPILSGLAAGHGAAGRSPGAGLR
ncbi:MAG: uridine diphosphate-N-acetylglucosamine-binding protein YvcK [Candidatus Rokubacteria bacterium]|nr:uridine diphosphate-N-acetylglucosamine-binding protein YvcK [Candidatus Rokubacteria bacterium]